MMHHLAAQRADHGTLEVEIADEERAGGDVEDGAREGFVEGGVGVAEAGEAGAGAEGGCEGGAEGEEGVFSCVVVVDCCGFLSVKSYTVEELQAGKGRIILAKSPLHRTRRLHPACFAQACSM